MKATGVGTAEAKRPSPFQVEALLSSARHVVHGGGRGLAPDVPKGTADALHAAGWVERPAESTEGRRGRKVYRITISAAGMTLPEVQAALADDRARAEVAGRAFDDREAERELAEAAELARLRAWVTDRQDDELQNRVADALLARLDEGVRREWPERSLSAACGMLARVYDAAARTWIPVFLEARGFAMEAAELRTPDAVVDGDAVQGRNRLLYRLAEAVTDRDVTGDVRGTLRAAAHAGAWFGGEPTEARVDGAAKDLADVAVRTGQERAARRLLVQIMLGDAVTQVAPPGDTTGRDDA